MNHTKIFQILVMLFAVVLCFGLVGLAAEPLGTAFTYQGRLIDANKPADGLYDLQFRLYDASSNGNQLGAKVNKSDVDVIDGYFTVKLNFGSDVFDGNDRWLEIGVRPGEQSDPCAYTTLSPRQEVTPTPYAIHAKTAGGIPGGIGGSGTANQIAKFMGPNTIGDSAICESGGNVGIGYTSPRSKLEVNGSINTVPDYGDPRYSRSIKAYAIESSHHYGHDATGNMYIGEGGNNVIIPGSLNVGNRVYFPGIGVFPVAVPVGINPLNGELFIITSSRRYKTNIQDLKVDTDAVLALRPVSFECKRTGQKDIGLIAEEVDEQVKDLVIYNKDGSPESVKYDRLGVYLLAIAKQQQSQLGSKKQQIENQQKQIDFLQERVSTLERLISGKAPIQEGGTQ
jgi:hypothetical protein